MKIKETMRYYSDSALNHRKSTEQAHMQHAMESLQREFSELFLSAGAGTLQWTGTVTDLLEVIHMMFLSGNIIDENGCPVTFKSLVERTFKVLDKSVPTNPRSYVQHAKRRKGFRQRAFIDRYCQMLVHEHVSRPLHLFVVRRTR